MDIEALQTFIEVADAGGVSPAARRLGVSKSIVSRWLIRLEEELGVQLFAVAQLLQKPELRSEATQPKCAPRYKIVTVRPQGRFKADNATALAIHHHP